VIIKHKIDGIASEMVIVVTQFFNLKNMNEWKINRDLSQDNINWKFED
jgi:hypothetical protein